MPRKKKSSKSTGDEVTIQSSQSSSPDWMESEAEGQLLVDVYQDDKNIYIKSTIAGVKPDGLDISLNNDMLTIRGTRDSEIDFEKADYFYQECYWGSFSRSIILPVEVKHDKISAVIKNGVLLITLPKAIRKRQIPIKVKND